MKTERKIPKFRSEAEEAAWWTKNRSELDKDFLEKARKGRLRRLESEHLAARLAKSSRVISIRLPEEDLALARNQASQKGLPYQSYIKSLLHQALRHEQ